MYLLYFLCNVRCGCFIVGKYFGGRTVESIIYVIEYQWRGLPHFHMAVRLKDAPLHSDTAAVRAFIDKHIFAEVPRRENFPHFSDAQFETYRETVCGHMLHRCAAAVNGCKKVATDNCKHGYSRTEPEPDTFMDGRGYWHYRRRTERDLCVVPHNDLTTIDWDGHLNVEYSGTVQRVLYLFKYLFKGVKKQSITITNNEQQHDEQKEDNEVELYLKARVLCSMDAVWRTLGFHTYPKSYPSVQTISVKLPSDVEFLLAKRQLCDLYQYFCRPAHLSHLKYTEFFNTYTVKKSLSAVQERSAPIDRVAVSILGVQYYYCKRPESQDTQHKHLTRMNMTYINHGEIYYLRVILLKRAVLNFEDARTDVATNTVHATFQLSAISHGYVRSHLDAEAHFLELSISSTPKEMRGYFVVMMLHGYSTLPLFLNLDHRDSLMADIVETTPDMGIAVNKLLQELERLLRLEGSSLESFGFPLPCDLNTELEIERLRYTAADQATLLQFLHTTERNNAGQQVAYDTIVNTIDAFVLTEGNQHPSAASQCIFLSGVGGTGKTALFRKLHAYCRSKGLLIQICAATTLAALLFKGGSTAHSLFKYPVVDDLDNIDAEFMPECQLHGTERLELLKHCTVIFWDEFVSNNRDLFEAVWRTFIGVNKKLIFVCAGDFHQILPVVKRGLKGDVIDATISSSPLWEKFKILHLTENMRLSGLRRGLTAESTAADRHHCEEQERYASFLLDLSCNNQQSPHLIVLHIDVVNPSLYKVGLPLLKYFVSSAQDDAVAWLYPNATFDATIALDSVILASTNIAVDRWNHVIQSLNPEPSKDYYSRDSFDEVDDENDTLRNMLNEETLNSFTRNGVPTHILTFKVNDVCLVLRAIPCLKLATNTRVQIVRLQSNSVRVKTLNEPTSRFVNIPRITFKFRLEYSESFQMTRMQLPLRLAYCITFNKSQSQTLYKVLCDCTGEPFAHGHAYVAFSRVRDCSNIRVFVQDEQLHPAGGDDPTAMMPVISNIVYNDVLLH
jgi:hypothetical protein